MHNVRTFTNWCFIVYFKPTCNVRTYANLTWDISFIPIQGSLFSLIDDSSNQIACFVWSQNLDPRDVYKRDHSSVDTRISLFSNKKPRSSIRCLPAIWPCVSPVKNKFDLVKKASSAMAASVGNTAPAIRACRRQITATLLKPVRLLTGAA